MRKSWVPFKHYFRQSLAADGDTHLFKMELLPITPSPLAFPKPDSEYTILAIRGFWNFAYNALTGQEYAAVLAGCVLPSAILDAPVLTLPDPFNALDGNDFFLYEPLAAVPGGFTTADPPFYSKGKRKVGSGDRPILILAVDAPEESHHSNHTFLGGVVGRMLIQY